MKLPDIVHVGYSKAMSTWLQKLFKDNDDIYYVRKTNFFIPYHNNYQKGIEYYEKHFIGSGKYQVVLESDEHLLMPGVHKGFWINTTNLRLIEKTMHRIKSTLPSVRIIVIIRNQVDMITSKYVQFVRRGGKISVNRFLDEIVFKNNNYLRYCDYRFSEVVQLLWSIFGKENVLIVILEEFRSTPDKIMWEISQFLGTDLLRGFKTKNKANVSPSFCCLKLEMMLNKMFVKQKRTHLCPATTRIPHKAWLRGYKLVETLDNKIIKNKGRDKILGIRNENRIRSIFSSDNKKFEKLLGRPLRSMGYF
jgi:hypothetical protein